MLNIVSIKALSVSRSSALLLLVFQLGTACTDKEDFLFERLSADHTNIHFSNTISESDTLNILNEEYIYNGGAVAVGDFNKDGLPDLYFTGNMVANSLYLNKGDITFQEIATAAGVTGEGRWCSGATVVDINGDGWQDIYVSVTMHKDSVQRKNLLYVNQGLNQDNIPTFKEAAASWGLADTGNTHNATFFDYDRDGDLDLYLLTNVVNNTLPTNYRSKITDGSAMNNDRLYRNNGNGTFTNVSKAAGILFEGFGLGITVADVNLDGWPDIYVANDYVSNDLLYINNRDGTFSNKIDAYIKHQNFSAMGTDVVDINNDGYVDIITLDMLPETNQRKKQMLGAQNYSTYINNEKYGYQYQYVRNVLQLNNGPTPKGHPTFSEIGQLSGIYQTDWSWAPLVADFDNDGHKDIIITNGFPKDVTDRDFTVYRSGNAGAVSNTMQLQDSIPVVKLSNYAFRNRGDLTFSDNTKAWGMDIPSFSNGAVYVDLDLDGDLDVVVNNINDKAFVYQNTLRDGGAADKNNYLRLALRGSAQNPWAIGAKVILYAGGGQQFFEQSVVRGYLASVEGVVHFGLGEQKKADSVAIYWPNGDYQLLKELAANQQIAVAQPAAGKGSMPPAGLFANALQAKPIFQEVSAARGIHLLHKEDDKVDFNIQRTLPHKYTQQGPGLAVGDVNGDGLDDFYVGGSAGKPGALFLQAADGSFQLEEQIGEKPEEDMGALFFDADGDRDLDLYVVSGSYEFEAGSPQLQDRFYRNMGRGRFQQEAAALPKEASSGSCVKAADFDADGDLDLFVGGRVVPGAYPTAPRSYLLKNEGGRFVDVTEQLAPELANIGMISDALWSDFDQDGQVDLILAGEWMPLTFFRNQGGKLENVSQTSGIAHLTGWWNSIVAGDFDGDGDVDYVAGNLGLNTHYRASEQQPLQVYAKDFDGNGRIDAVLSCYIKSADGQMKPYPMHTRDDLIIQMIRTRRQFQRYADYGAATIDQVLSPEDREGALILAATHFASTYFENAGNGTFRAKALPMQAQVAPVFGMLSDDFDGDGKLDLLLVGNSFATEVFTGRYDASIGLFLKGDGRGSFLPQAAARSGFFVEGDAKAMARVYDKQGEALLLVSQNQDSLRVFGRRPIHQVSDKEHLLLLEPLDARALVEYQDGRTERREFYYGATYLSQSSRRLALGPEARLVTFFDYQGNSRKVTLSRPQNETLAER